MVPACTCHGQWWGWWNIWNLHKKKSCRPEQLDVRPTWQEIQSHHSVKPLPQTVLAHLAWLAVRHGLRSPSTRRGARFGGSVSKGMVDGEEVEWGEAGGTCGEREWKYMKVEVKSFELWILLDTNRGSWIPIFSNMFGYWPDCTCSCHEGRFLRSGALDETHDWRMIYHFIILYPFLWEHIKCLLHVFWFELEALAPREVWTGWWPLGGHLGRKDRWDNFNLMQFISTYRANHWRNNSKNIPCFEEVVSEQFKSVDFVFGISQHRQVAVPYWWIGTRCRKISWSYAWL